MFYDRFLDLCKEKGVKPSRVATDTGFNKGSVSVWKKKYENGEDTQPTSEILSKIADYFNVSIDYLLGKTIQKASLTDDKKQDDNIRFALWGGDAEIVDDEMMQDVRDFAKLIAEKKKRKLREQHDKQSE